MGGWLWVDEWEEETIVQIVSYDEPLFLLITQNHDLLFLPEPKKQKKKKILYVYKQILLPDKKINSS